METLFIGKNLLRFDELPSTNSWLIEGLSTQLFPEGTVVFAVHQTQGKGQRGSNWDSQISNSLTFSILLKPTFLPIATMFDLSVCVALALCNCLNELRPGFKVKWPNDIYFGNKKIAGVLIENQMNKSICQNAVIGIGLNVNQEFFTGLPKATSLKQIVGVHFRVENIMERICELLEAKYLKLKSGAYNTLFKEYLGLMYWLNESHTFRSNKHEFRAVLKSVLRNGRLLLEFPDGQQRDFDIKEIEFIE